MAVEYKYCNANFNTDGVNTKLIDSINGGGLLQYMFSTVEIAAADDILSKYIVFPDLPAGLVPLEICAATDGIAGLTSGSLGLYQSKKGAVIAAGTFSAAVTYAVAVASLNPKTALDAMAAVDIANYGRRLFEHALHTTKNKLKSYDITLLANTEPTGAGTISFAMKYMMS